MTRPAQQHRGGGATDVRLPQQRASQSRAGQPRAGQSKASQSKAAQPRAGQPKSAQSRAGQPSASQSRSAQPRAGQSKTAQPRSRRPTATQPGPAQSRSAQAGSAQSRSAQARSAQSGAAQSRPAQPRSAQPAVAQRGVAQRGVAQPGALDTGPTEIWDAHAPQPPVRQAGAAPRYQPGTRRTSGQPLCAAWDPLAEDGPRARQARGRRRPPPQGRRGLSGFFRSYGWRAYALPVLLVLTALAAIEAGQPSVLPIGSSGSPQPSAAAAPTIAPTTAEPTPTPLVPNPAGNEKYDAAKVSAELPAGGPFAESGTGNWLVIPGSTERFGAGELFTYTVEIEEGVQLPGGPEGFAHTVDATLNNPKSWIGSTKYAFQRIDTGTPRIRISLASQQTARSICGFKIQFDASCWRGGRTVLNAARWERGAVVFQGNVIAYQQYVVNHEVGHALGFGHRPCAEHGALAPIMMQQTWGVSNDYLAVLGTDNVQADGKVCAANPWPYPTQGG